MEDSNLFPSENLTCLNKQPKIVQLIEQIMNSMKECFTKFHKNRPFYNFH